MKTMEKLKQMIGYWEDFEVPELVERDFDTSLIDSDKILSIYGPRRAGKTYLCYQIIERLKEKFPKNNILYVNFEDERLYPLNGDELTKLLEAYYEVMEPDDERIFMFLDEIQSIPYWEKWCRRIDERENKIKLVITGSSSKVMPSELSSSLRGRSLNHVVFPFSFKEFLRAKGSQYGFEGKKDYYYTKKKSRFKKAFNEYMNYGGFPEIVLEEDEKMKGDILREYYSTIFYKDIIENFNVDNVEVLEDFIKMRIDNFGSLMSFTQSRNNLKSIGHRVGKTTLSKYFSYANKAFLLFEVERYEHSSKKRQRYPRKVYPIDTGLVNAVRFNFSEELGNALETLVFLELKRRGKTVYYSSGDGECDFLIEEKGKLVEALQVTWSLQGTEEREISGLIEGMEKHGIEKGLILTEDEKDVLDTGKGKVEVLPVWLWMLIEDKDCY